MIGLLFNSGLTGPELVVRGCILVIVLVFSLSIHEFMHGYAALRLGDDTAKLQGRLTLNPLAHLDPIGSLMMLLAGFGWAKPVQVNYSRLNRFKNRDISIRIVSVAGVTANFVVAFVSYVLLMTITVTALKAGLLAGLIDDGASLTIPETIVKILTMFFTYMYMFNLMLMAFNLLPIPPLDGYHFLETFLPYKWKQKIQGYERYAGMVLFLLIIVGNSSGFSPLRWLITTIETPFIYIIETPINMLADVIIRL